MQQSGQNHSHTPEAEQGGRHVYSPSAGRAGAARPAAGRAPSFERRAAPQRGGTGGSGGSGGHGGNGGGGNPWSRFTAFVKGLFANRRARLNILIGAVIVLLVIAILLALFVPGCVQRGGDGSSSSALTSSSDGGDSGSYVDPNYDKDANSLPVEQLQGTILGETKDMGQDYVTDTLFLGDSNTERMAQFRDITGVTRQNCIGVESMGITHITSLACVQFQGYNNPVTMVEAVKLLKPRRIVTNFGTNNIGGMSDTDLLAYYKTALTAIHEAYPYADIIIGSIFPIAQKNSYPAMTMTDIDKLNKGLAELAKEEDYRYLDWSASLKDPKTGYCQAAYVLDDGIHLNQRGMEAIFTYFRTHALDTEDKRPKPLGDIPTVQGVPSGLFPKPESSSSSASVPVSFTAGEGGLLEMNEQEKASFSLEILPGAQTPRVKAIPKEGYVFKNWVFTGISLTGTKTATLEPFTVPTGTDAKTGITVMAVFEKAKAYTITLNYLAATGGTVSPASQVFENVLPGATISFASTATPNANYEFSGWTPNAGTVANGTAGGGSFTVPTDITANTSYTLTAGFKAKAVATYTVTLNYVSGGNGSVGTASQQFANVKPGDVLAFASAATPNANYAFSSWTASAGAVSNGTAAGGSFTVPADLAADITYTITANFVDSRPTYAVTFQFSVNGSGSVTPNPATVTVHAGDVITIPGTATAADGFQFIHWINNADPGNPILGNSFTIPADLSGPTTYNLTAYFEAIQTEPLAGDEGGG